MGVTTAVAAAHAAAAAAGRVPRPRARARRLREEEEDSGARVRVRVRATARPQGRRASPRRTNGQAMMPSCTMRERERPARGARHGPEASPERLAARWKALPRTGSGTARRTWSARFEEEGRPRTGAGPSADAGGASSDEDGVEQE